MAIDRTAAIEWFRRNRGRSHALFALIPDEAYVDRPIALRNPICFYEGHIPAFGVNTLWKKALGEPGIRPDYEVLFERGIDPDEAPTGSGPAWPTRGEIREYGRRADAVLETAMRERPLESESPKQPMLRRAQALWAVLEHEVMHQETLHYMWRRMPYDRKLPRDGVARPLPGPSAAPPATMVRVPAGRATLGVDPDAIRFAWDNEMPGRVVDVPAFSIDVHNVSNERFLEFVEAGGYRREELWDPEGWRWVVETGATHPPFWARGEKGDWEWIGMFERRPLPPAWPVWATLAEASAYARWKGMRVPTEAEYHRAAFGTPSRAERAHPWGDAAPDETRGNFDFRQWEPVAVGSFPSGVSAWGIHDLVGNGWEWTSSLFEPFPGFEPLASYPVYSTDFFDGKHYVLKGASPVTGRELVRRTFRNWFRPNYPHVYASFRCAKDAA